MPRDRRGPRGCWVGWPPHGFPCATHWWRRTLQMAGGFETLAAFLELLAPGWPRSGPRVSAWGQLTSGPADLSIQGPCPPPRRKQTPRGWGGGAECKCCPQGGQHRGLQSQKRRWVPWGWDALGKRKAVTGGLGAGAGKLGVPPGRLSGGGSSHDLRPSPAGPRPWGSFPSSPKGNFTDPPSASTQPDVNRK